MRWIRSGRLFGTQMRVFSTIVLSCATCYREAADIIVPGQLGEHPQACFLTCE
jgi:hypothetical protein